MADEIIVHRSKRPGMAGTTPIHIKKHEDGSFEARMGFAIFGSTQMDEEGFKNCDYNPFHPEFYDNFGAAIGTTEEEAIDNLEKDMNSTYESFWI